MKVRYRIAINSVDGNGAAIDNAKITVTERGKEIAPDDNGRFMLCSGSYIVRISADGYTALREELEVSLSMNSKELEYILEEGVYQHDLQV